MNYTLKCFIGFVRNTLFPRLFIFLRKDTFSQFLSYKINISYSLHCNLWIFFHRDIRSCIPSIFTSHSTRPFHSVLPSPFLTCSAIILTSFGVKGPHLWSHNLHRWSPICGFRNFPFIFISHVLH